MLAIADTLTLAAGFTLYAAVTPHLLPLTPPACPTHATAYLAAALVASSHALYAAIWYYPHTFRHLAERTTPLRFLGANAVGVFSVLVALLKICQQLGLFLIVSANYADTSAAVRDIVLAASPPRLLAAVALLAAGQLLNASIYMAIGKDGVYYGFKLGRPVPWSNAFPFSAGFRHPQYVGGILCELGLFSICSTRTTCEAGLPYLLAWWLALYALTSAIEASGDNDGAKSSD